MATKALLMELQTAIAEYLDTHSNMSIQSLSNKAHVSYSTVRRILQNEANDVRDETILSLIQVVMSRPRRIDFLNRYYPALGALIHQDQSEDTDLDQEKLRLFRYKDPHNYVLKMALTASGTNRTTIRRILGERGVSALEEMIEEGFLVDDSSGTVYHSSRGSVIMNADDILYQIKKDTDYFNKDLVGSKFSRLAHLSASLNQEAYQQLMELVNDFIKKSERFKEDPKNRGKTPIFIDLMINTYDKDSLEGAS